MVTKMYEKSNPHPKRAGSNDKHQKKTMEALNSNTGRVGGPTSMYTPDPMRLSKGKYKGTR
jgi:hypothetical protein